MTQNPGGERQQRLRSIRQQIENGTFTRQSYDLTKDQLVSLGSTVKDFIDILVGTGHIHWVDEYERLAPNFERINIELSPRQEEILRRASLKSNLPTPDLIRRFIDSLDTD